MSRLPYSTRIRQRLTLQHPLAGTDRLCTAVVWWPGKARKPGDLVEVGGQAWVVLKTGYTVRMTLEDRAVCRESGRPIGYMAPQPGTPASGGWDGERYVLRSGLESTRRPEWGRGGARQHLRVVGE